MSNPQKRKRPFTKRPHNAPVVIYCADAGRFVPVLGTTRGSHWLHPTCSGCYKRVKVVL